MVETDSPHPRPLKAYNPLDHLRLLGWLLFKPDRLSAYKFSFGDHSVQKVGAWTFSTMCWLPLLMIATGVASGLLTVFSVQPSSASSPEVQIHALVLSGSILLSWLLTEWLGTSSGKKYNIFQSAGLLILMVTACLCIVDLAFWISFFIGGEIIYNVTEGIGLAALLSHMSLLAFMTCVSFASALPEYLGGQEGKAMSWVLRFFLWLGAAMSTLIVLGLVNWYFPIIDVVGTLLALVPLLLFTLPLLVTPALNYVRQKGLPHSVILVMNTLLVVVLAASYAMLAWLSYFDGWETINRLSWTS
jgi:hypothetical protein